MMREEWSNGFCDQNAETHEEQQDSAFNFNLLSLVSKTKDYYRILEVDYDATEEVIRSNYIRLALKWHPDKQKDQDGATSKFQEINEAYQGFGKACKLEESPFYDEYGWMICLERSYQKAGV